jgi:hypothetical protein
MIKKLDIAVGEGSHPVGAPIIYNEGLGVWFLPVRA